MPQIHYQAFSKARALPKDAPYGVYGLMGDSYLQGEVLAALLEWLLPGEEREFNMDTVDGATASISDLMARCGNLPFLADRRIVLLRRAEQLEGIGKSQAESDADDDDESGAGERVPEPVAATSGKAAKSKPRARLSPAKRFGEAIASLPPTTHLILTRTPESPEPGARKLTPRCMNAAVDKGIEKIGLIIDCSVGAKAAPMAIAAINNVAQKRGIALARGAAEHLVARAGLDIANLLNELEKCALRAGPGESVTVAIINEMTLREPQETIFDLMDALGQRQGARAVNLLHDLMQNGTAPELALSTMVTHLRQLIQARAFLDARVPLDASAAERLPPALAAQLPRDTRQNLATLLQAQSWRGGRLTAQARNFTTAQLQEAMAGALAVDLAVKGVDENGGDTDMLLELFLARLC